MADSFYEATKQRLERYGVFAPDVIESVAAFAQKQLGFKTHQDFFTSIGVGESFVFTLKNGDGVPVIDIPAKDVPQKGVLVIHTSMSTPLDASQIYQLASVAGAHPQYRVIGFGNPAGGAHLIEAQSLSWWRRLRVALFKDMRPIIAPELAYLESQEIKKWHQIGFSYGALKATAESEYMTQDSLAGLLVLDPVSPPRNLIRLGLDFKKTYGPLGKYVNATNLKTYHQARAAAAKDFGENPLYRPINIAIAVALSRINIFTRITRVMSRHPRASVAIAWAAKSELGSEVRTKRFIARLNTGKSLGEQVQSIRLEDTEHAFANDIHLYLAVVSQFLMRG